MNRSVTRTLMRGIWLALALWLAANTTQARWMNPNTGRFQTMDSYEGSPTEPASLHKYLYCHASPANGVDPSGHEYTISGVYYGMSARVYLFGQSHATVIGAASVGLRTLALALVVADSVGLITNDRDLAGAYISCGVNPMAELNGIVGEVRTLRTALVVARAARLAPQAERTFSEVEMAVLQEARQMLYSSEMARIREAHKAGRELALTIGGRYVQVQPGLPWSAFTNFREQGFTLGDQAFASEEELAKTILHELRRLSTSSVVTTGRITCEVPAPETFDAYTFAERAYEQLFR